MAILLIRLYTNLIREEAKTLVLESENMVIDDEKKKLSELKFKQEQIIETLNTKVDQLKISQGSIHQNRRSSDKYGRRRTDGDRRQSLE